MRFATIADGSRDGRLVRVSDDGQRMVPVRDAETLQQLLDRWDIVAPALATFDPRIPHGEAFDPSTALAPLPRSWQFLDASAFSNHGELMQRAYDLPPIPTDPPLMYQGLSHQFLGGSADVPLPDETGGIDFEAEFAVIVGEVPMGTTPAQASKLIRLVVLLNDWSLRAIGAAEMRTGFGWVRAKPACAMGPIAVTPDELGDAWRDARVCLPMQVTFRSEAFGAALGDEMEFGFHELVAHAASTRTLCAGTVIGSGTVSNRRYRERGSSCIAERRAIEAMDAGAPSTAFMRFGERVRITAMAGGDVPFGIIDQRVVASAPADAARTAEAM